MTLSSIAIEQIKATDNTMNRHMQMLDYFATNDMAKIRFHALEMILNIHSDVSYLSESRACSRACGHFFMGWMPKDNKPIKLNGAFHTDTTIMRFVMVSTAEAQLGTLVHNCQIGILFDKHWIT
jgi:hypothetical protein